MAGSDIYTGTLDILILKALSGGSLHGYGIGLWLRRKSMDVFQVKEGVLYPALHRLLGKGLATARWDVTDTGRRARFYTLTPKGERHLSEHAAELAAHSEAVLAVLATPAR
jgi:PadR family transcriptional regulator PadR